jgi:predicted nucleic acid-binding protein
MHVFIDTNILLNFFHFSKDELDALNDVFASHEHGAAKVHLTQQVCDEFKRNRENKIKDALKRFKEIKFAAQLPSFMKAYEEYNTIRRLSTELQSAVKAISEKVDADIVAQQLLADSLISDIFARAEIIPTSPEVFSIASMRGTIGNPPGKAGSIGDAINWTLLLQNVPDEEPLHIISEDGDFYSTLNEDAAHPFLEEEWQDRKRSSLRVYRTLSSFMKEHFDGVAFPFDRAKEALIDDLSSSGSFASTHDLIAKLEGFSYFSLKEVERVLAAAVANNQFGRIATDTDVSDFLNRVAVPRLGSIVDPQQIEILQTVIEEQRQRTEINA